ncbi:hypothetical protein BMR03_02815, partial [Methylococcaceae bacterium HT2]
MSVNKAIAETREILFTDSANVGWTYQELIGVVKTAYIIGGGHVSLALSQVLALLDFDIVVIDLRDAVQTMQDNKFAKRKIIVPY